MVRVLFMALVWLASGCSLLFDPDALPDAPDLSQEEPPPDAAVPEDAARPPDLTPPDLACTPLVFAGFGDGGATSPVVCPPCGCVVDPFIDPPSRRWAVNTPVNWTASSAGGTMTVSSGNAGPAQNAGLASITRFYLDGDFVLSVDFDMTAVVGGYIHLYTLGPLNGAMTNYIPHAQAFVFREMGGTYRAIVAIDDGTVSLPTPGAQGTMEIRRLGSLLCGRVVGQADLCRPARSTDRVAVYLTASNVNAGCLISCVGAACCSYTGRYRNLRLQTGTLVDNR